MINGKIKKKRRKRVKQLKMSGYVSIVVRKTNGIARILNLVNAPSALEKMI